MYVCTCILIMYVCVCACIPVMTTKSTDPGHLIYNSHSTFNIREADRNKLYLNIDARSSVIVHLCMCVYMYMRVSLS